MEGVSISAFTHDKHNFDCICFSHIHSRLIRIELNQSLCDYYTELDAVYVTGTISHEDDALNSAMDKSLDHLLNCLSLQDSGTLSENSQNEPPPMNRDCCGSFQVLPVSKMQLIRDVSN